MVHASTTPDSGNNVILLTLDGVRWQEVFHGPDPVLQATGGRSTIFSSFTQTDRPRFLVGDRVAGDNATAGDLVPVSLPGYYTMFGGSRSFCLNDDCSRIPVETVAERVSKAYGLSRYQVATIASWGGIRLAAEHIEGATFVNAGSAPLVDGSDDPALRDLNAQQLLETPIQKGTRKDKFTFAHAMRYLEKYRPRFLYIALDDSDQAGHSADYASYVATLRQYDEWIDVLTRTLASLGPYGQRTTVLITTDHGRGTAADWSNHGFWHPQSRWIWLYATGGNVHSASPRYRQSLSLLDIRPTIEAILGLQPRECFLCGHVITDIVGRGE